MPLSEFVGLSCTTLQAELSREGHNLWDYLASCPKLREVTKKSTCLLWKTAPSKKETVTGLGVNTEFGN